MTHSFPTRRSSDLWSTGLDAIPLLDQRRRLFLRGIDMAAAQGSALLRAPFLDALVFLVRPCLEPRAQTVERAEVRRQELVARRLGGPGRVAVALRVRRPARLPRCSVPVCARTAVRQGVM